MIILIIILILSQTTIPYVSAGTSTIYARIMQENCYLYRSPIGVDDYTNVYFELPKTYFVELLSSPNEEFYEARYMDNIGYVKKDSVQAITGTPVYPYQSDVTFRVYASLSQDLRSAPTVELTNHIATIPLLTRNIIYIGAVDGECLIEGRTRVWYYCRYIGDRVYDGYVYSDFCDEMSQMTNNTEEVTYTMNPTFSNQSNEPQSTSTDGNLVGIVIGILSIPALIFVFMLIKSRQILSHDPSNSEIGEYYKRTER